MGDIHRVPPLHYVHVLDQNTNATRLEVGPVSLALATHEKLVYGPDKMVIIPPACYCIISNPVVRNEDLTGSNFALRLGHREVRFHQPPFPLYPGEELEKTAGKTAVQQLEIIRKGQAINLLALDDCVDENGEKRVAGEEYQLLGPFSYHPRVDVQRNGVISQRVVEANHSLKIKAKRDLVDRHGVKRKTGDIWLMRKSGPYIPTVYEEVAEVVKPHILTDNIGLHIRSNVTHTDVFNHLRKRGDEWLVTNEFSETYTPDVTEEVIAVVNRVTLNQAQYCFVVNVVDEEGKNQLGKRELRKGVCSFFLKPGEKLEKGVQKAFLLEGNEAVLLRALVTFTDMVDPNFPKGKERVSGEMWMVYGPTLYIPTIEVEPIQKRKAISLDEQEGVYVRNIRSGAVKVVMGPRTFMLGVEEVLYEKELSPTVENLLVKGGGDGDEEIRKVAYFSAFVEPALLKGPRDRTHVVKYRVPPGTAVQINDHVLKTSRYVFGPALAILQPHEEFMVFSLSAGKPKRANALKTLVLMLGPDFITDVIKVETCDHAVLNIRLSYNNEFIVNKDDEKSIQKIFSVPDFIGYACSMIGARIREHVAQVTFDQFHRNSNNIVEEAVFHRDENGKVQKTLLLEANDMIISNVDVHSIEPADPQVLTSLTKSVQMAIEIATKSIETTAKHEAHHENQKALGALELQKLGDAAAIEKSRMQLLQIQSENAAIETGGTAIAEATARAEKSVIEGESHVRLATLRAQAVEIEVLTDLQILENKRKAEIKYQREMTELEIHRAQQKAEIEVERLRSFVSSLTPKAIVAIAASGPKMQAKLLQSLGIQSTLITDGKSPINLFQTAKGLIETPQIQPMH